MQSDRTEAIAFSIMPKITGPCLSSGATGTLARILTYVRTRRGAVIKKHVTKRDPATFDQLYRRWMFFYLQSNWTALQDVDKDSWNDLAQFYDVSANNAYLGTNMERWDRFEVPSAYLPIQQTGSTGTVSVFGIAKDHNRIKLNLKVSPIAQNWGMILYFAHAFPPPHARQNVIQINLQNDSSTHYYYYYPTEPGWHAFRVSIFSHNGERYDYAVTRWLNWT